ncbi:hypothetical protein D0Y65_014282 [Glycine soja]|uniref:Uncharacterized protein n=1 Tax=Glycine soja TaxID=3848 RepID=A0A445K7H2_GLYSO|nr:hypothetical protein D0Y65_014282 [Glycine soja]
MLSSLKISIEFCLVNQALWQMFKIIFYYSFVLVILDYVFLRLNVCDLPCRMKGQGYCC